MMISICHYSLTFTLCVSSSNMLRKRSRHGMSEEPQESVYDILFAKLELNEIFGQLTATTLLLQSLIETLKEAGFAE